MPVINDVYSLLRFEEGERLFVYDDATGRPITKGSVVVGNPTIGVGRALNVHGISQNESDTMLVHDVQNWTSAFANDPWFNNLDAVRKAAIVDMTHALGVFGVREFTGMIAALETRDWGAACDAVLASKWNGEAPERAQRVALMLQDGSWPTG